ncbi:long-chain-fatty-acid--CoA ligase 5-like [Lytechinus pictus]|uniref:long-chain-fatty-acid--CoA ligase 5-like n=1 Tax=Lytechinus pictus TaxID=7653 RepID=UPI0030B9C053
MAEFCVRVLVKGKPLSRLAFVSRGILGNNYAVTSSQSVRHGSEYFKSIFPVDEQTIRKEGPERIRVIRRNNEQYLPTQQYSDVTTLYEGFQRGKRVSNDGSFLGHRIGPGQPYQWISFSQVEERARLFGSGLVSLGFSPGSETFIGIFSQNRPEWTIVDFACICYSMVSVPLYTSLGKDALKHIAEQTNMSVLVCDVLDKAESVLEYAANLPHLKAVVVMDLPLEGGEETRHKFEAAGLRLLSYDDVIDRGTSNPCDRVLPKPTDLNTIVYTSGTTGTPKGVPLTQGHHIVNHAYVHSAFDVPSFGSPDDYHLSYLPLAHVFERGNMYHGMIQGTHVGFFQGDPLLLLDDLQTLKPTVFFAVPRIFNRIHHQITLGVTNSSPLKRSIFSFAYQQKSKNLQKGIISNDTIWDKLVFKKIQDIFGGRMRFLFSGAAPISEEVATFFRVTVGCPFFEGYGQTETTSIITHTIDIDMSPGHVGVPGGDMEIKLVDVPDLNYHAKDDEGEIFVRGKNVFTGYYKDPEKTKEALDEDGWLHTGDIGRWNKNGTLSVIDRKKQILKLAQGLYVAPEKVENVYTRLPLLTQIFVYGDSMRDFIVGIVVPDPQELEKVARSVGVTGSFEELCQNKKVTGEVLRVLQKHGKAEGLQGFEQVQAISLNPEQFSEQNGLLTPTLKTKRSAMEKAFKNQLDNLYTTTDTRS